MTYILLDSPSAYELTDLVNKYLDEGWTLFGPPIASSGGKSKDLFAQALTKHKKDRKLGPT